MGHALHVHKHHHHRSPFTGYAVAGKTSTFGLPEEPGPTASGISTAEPCIAIYESRTLGRWFELHVQVGERHGRPIWSRWVKVVHCDVGPAPWTGRKLDLTGAADERLGFAQSSYPTETEGVARELR